MTVVKSSGRARRRSRAEWHAIIAPLYAEGATGLEIARRFGIGSGFVYDVLNDPAGDKARARKDSYRRPCPNCGRLMSGADGPKIVRSLCGRCSREQQHEERKWTRDAVIDAIQRFAEAHGRPPSANEWVTADPVNGYPPRSAVYASSHSNAPFAKWADAIEAAGFARPESGKYDRSARRYRGRSAGATLARKSNSKEEKIMGTTQRRFIVLEQNGEGWIEHEPVPTWSEALAVEAAAKREGKTEGRFVAIPESRWVVRKLEPVTTVKAVTVDS